MTDLLSIAAFAADQLCLSVMPTESANPPMQMEVDYIIFDGSPIVQIDTYERMPMNTSPNVCAVNDETCTAYRLTAFQTPYCLNHQDIPDVCRQTDGCCCSECMGTESPEPWCPHGTDPSCNCLDEPQSRTAQIMAEMRQDNADAVRTFNESVDETVEAKGKRMRRTGVIHNGGPTYRAMVKQEQAKLGVSVSTLLRGLDHGRNSYKRDCQLPARAISMAATRGRVTPDGQESVLLFFTNPTDMAQHLLGSFLPAKVSAARMGEILADGFYCDVVEGLGFVMPSMTEVKQVFASINANRANVGAVMDVMGSYTLRQTGAPRQVRVFTPDVEVPTAPSKPRRGRPAGMKRVAHLEFGTGHSKPYTSEAMPMGRIPGGNDVMHGPGFGRGLV